MPKMAFMGAGSTVFAKNVLGDCMCAEPLKGSTIALYDIDKGRLDDSARMLRALNRNLGAGMAIEKYLGVAQRKAALRDAAYVVNAVQVGGYEPSTVIDFEIPRKYGLRQTIGDTLGIGGIFRALRTIPVLLDFARDMEAVCPKALFMNYSNPIAMLIMGLARGSAVKAVGLCHSVDGCAPRLLRHFEIEAPNLQYKVAGINHQGWLLEVTDNGRDLYPEIKKRAREAEKNGTLPARDRVRLEIMKRFGYYVTESSEHTSEYVPWFIKARYPELIEKFNIPLDEYPRRCVRQIEGWKNLRRELVRNKNLAHARSKEYASYMMEAMETNRPFKFGGNVLNTGLITNLPARAVVEVPCIADRTGVTPCFVGDLPEPCAALNRTNINVQILAVEAALTRKKEYLYQAAMLDPHTGSELPIDQIVRLCDALLRAHGPMIPKMR
ncbi:MAG: alpha-glucosidase/alpha-galactosidase [Kiritimatiellae bacterium]|nr:alpha-glucosidase/alpha-galactosidase [Kiritimatiellia bacterium]